MGSSLAYPGIQDLIISTQQLWSSDKINAVIAAIATSGINIPVIGTPTIDKLNEQIDFALSAGTTVSTFITDAGSQQFDVTAGAGFIRTTDSHTGFLKSFEWAQKLANTIPDGTVRYVGIEYNAGSPQVVVKTGDTWDTHTEFRLGSVVREGTDLYILNNAQSITNGIAHIYERLFETDPLKRDNRSGGLILSELGTRNIAVSAGALRDGLNKFTIAAIDTSGSDTFDAYYGSFTKVAAQTQWDNLQYDNAGVLTALGVSKWASHWFYLLADGHIDMIYSSAQFNTQAAAEASTAPASVPLHIQEHGVILGRLIFQQNAGSAAEVQSAYKVDFSGTGVTNHGELGAIQGGAAGEYYHLTATEHTEATRDATSAQNGLATAAHIALLEKLENMPVNNQTGTSYTPVLTDANKWLVCTNGGAFAFTIPTNAAVAFPVGASFPVVRGGTGSLTFDHAGVTVYGELIITDQYFVAVCKKLATDIWIIVGGTGDAAIPETLFDANTILKADTDDTPTALTVPVQTIVGRITAGVITALTPAQVRTLINVEDGADVTDWTNVAAALAAATGNIDVNGQAITNVGNVDGRAVSADGSTLDAHVASTANPHSVTAAQAGAYTIAEVNALVDETLKPPEAFAPAGTYPVTYGGNAVEKGDTFRITGAGTMGAITVNVEDLLIALVDTPAQVDANWMVAESNRDQATETVKGVAELATQAEADAGTNDTNIITPLKMATAPVNTHDLGGAAHSADTFANVNSKVSDENLVAFAGQLGGTAAVPDIRGIRETGGPTLLTIGAIADGQYARRSGATLVGDAPGGTELLDWIPSSEHPLNGGATQGLFNNANMQGFTCKTDRDVTFNRVVLHSGISLSGTFTARVAIYQATNGGGGTTWNKIFDGTFTNAVGGNTTFEVADGGAGDVTLKAGVYAIVIGRVSGTGSPWIEAFTISNTSLFTNSLASNTRPTIWNGVVSAVSPPATVDPTAQAASTTTKCMVHRFKKV